MQNETFKNRNASEERRLTILWYLFVPCGRWLDAFRLNFLIRPGREKSGKKCWTLNHVSNFSFFLLSIPPIWEPHFVNPLILREKLLFSFRIEGTIHVTVFLSGVKDFINIVSFGYSYGRTISVGSSIRFWRATLPNVITPNRLDVIAGNTPIFIIPQRSTLLLIFGKWYHLWNRRT